MQPHKHLTSMSNFSLIDVCVCVYINQPRLAGEVNNVDHLVVPPHNPLSSMTTVNALTLDTTARLQETRVHALMSQSQVGSMAFKWSETCCDYGQDLQIGLEVGYRSQLYGIYQIEKTAHLLQGGNVPACLSKMEV